MILREDVLLPYTLDFFKATMHPTKKATPKAKRLAKDNQGNGRPNTVARRSSVEWVKGKKYNRALAASGSWLSEKKVPHRKVIGKITRVLNVLMP